MGGLTRLAAPYPARREERGGAFSIVEAAAMARDKEAVAEARTTPIRLRLDFSPAWIRKNNPHAGDTLTPLRSTSGPERPARRFVWRKNHNDLNKISSSAKRFRRRTTASSLLIGHDIRDR
jgi:hypothetical protein